MHLKASPTPKYFQLSEILRRQILSGEIAPNTQIPTEEILCRDYGFSRGTVRKAVDLLANEGLIRREQGRGTFANGPKPSLNPFSLGEVDPRQNRAVSTRRLALELLPASTEVSELLGLCESEPVIHVVQLRCIDDRPLIYEERYLAQALCPGLVNEDLETQSIHRLLIHKYRLPLIRVIHTIEARPLSADEARLLDADVGMSAFFVDRLTYTIDSGSERPAVWYRAIYRGDEYQFKAEFQASL